MQIHVLGVAAIIFFYVLILAVGIWAGRKSKGQTNSEEVMLAGRNIGLIVGVFTMTGELVDRLADWRVTGDETVETNIFVINAS